MIRFCEERNFEAVWSIVNYGAIACRTSFLQIA
jgi:hypothetical protein